MQHVAPILEAFVSGIGFATLIRAAIDQARDSWTRRRPPAPHSSFNPDPRGEAKAILEITNWNFEEAFNLVAGRITAGEGSQDFWIKVAQCLEIFQAGREVEAA